MNVQKEMRLSMDSLAKKISKLEAQKEKIQKEIEALTQQRNQELLSVLDKHPFMNLDAMTLIGGLLHVAETVAKNPTTKEVWQKDGQKFFRQHSSAKTHQPLKKAA